MNLFEDLNIMLLLLFINTYVLIVGTMVKYIASILVIMVRLG